MEWKGLEILDTVVQFMKKSEISYYEMHLEEDNYVNFNIQIDLCNCVNIEIFTKNNNFYIMNNTIDSDKFCSPILVNDSKQLITILTNLEVQGHNLMNGGVENA